MSNNQPSPKLGGLTLQELTLEHLRAAKPRALDELPGSRFGLWAGKTLAYVHGLGFAKLIQGEWNSVSPERVPIETCIELLINLYQRRYHHDSVRSRRLAERAERTKHLIEVLSDGDPGEIIRELESQPSQTLAK